MIKCFSRFQAPWRPQPRVKEVGKLYNRTTVNSNLETTQTISNYLANTTKAIEKDLRTQIKYTLTLA